MRLRIGVLPKLRRLIAVVAATTLIINTVSIHKLTTRRIVRHGVAVEQNWDVLKQDNRLAPWLTWNHVPRQKEQVYLRRRRNLCAVPFRYTVCSVNMRSLFYNDTVLINNQMAYGQQRTRSGTIVILTLAGCRVKDVHRFKLNHTREVRLYLDKLPTGTYFLGIVTHQLVNNTDVRAILLLPRTMRMSLSRRVESPVNSLFIGRVGYWNQISYKYTTKKGDHLELNKVIYYGTSFPVRKDPRSYDEVLKTNRDMKAGGFWHPDGCRPRWTLAVIVPFRNRYRHLAVFVENMLRFLKLQMISFTIFVVEQAGSALFNRAALMNVGYLEAQKERFFDCYAFHDVDLIPEDLANLYYCGDHPRHLAVTRSKNNYTVQLGYDYFGGAILMRPDHIEEINGFPNTFYGWGAEDDEILQRIKNIREAVDRYPVEIAGYTCLPHTQDRGNPHSGRSFRYAINHARNEYANDGLNTAEYDIIKRVKTELYTHILVEIHRK